MFLYRRLYLKSILCPSPTETDKTTSVLLTGPQASSEVHGLLLRAGRGTKAELVLIDTEVRTLQGDLTRALPHSERQVFKHALPLTLCPDDEIRGHCDVWDIGAGGHGDRCGEGVRNGDDMREALPDLAAQVDASNDARGCGFERNCVELIFTSLVIFECHLDKRHRGNRIS